MYCSNCGNSIDDNAAFCPNCGTAVASNAGAPVVAEPQTETYEQPQEFVNPQGYTEQPYQQPFQQPYDPYQQGFFPQQPMKWFKFLIYFALWASGILNIIGGIPLLTGSHYGEYASQIYSYYDGLQLVDVILGLASIGLGVLAIYARFRLAGYYKNGPQFLSILYIATAALSVFQIIAYNVVITGVSEYINYSSVVVQIAVSAVMVGVNNTYFKKRSDMFTK